MPQSRQGGSLLADGWTPCSPDVTLAGLPEGNLTFSARLAGQPSTGLQQTEADLTVYRTAPALQVWR